MGRWCLLLALTVFFLPFPFFLSLIRVRLLFSLIYWAFNLFFRFGVFWALGRKTGINLAKYNHYCDFFCVVFALFAAIASLSSDLTASSVDSISVFSTVSNFTLSFKSKASFTAVSRS